MSESSLPTIGELISATQARPFSGAYTAADVYAGAPAVSRDVRLGRPGKEDLEKDRLRQRRAGFATYAEPGDLVAPEGGADNPLFVDPHDRYDRDFAAEDKDARAAAAQRKAQDLARRRDEAATRDAVRRVEAEAAERHDEELAAARRADGSKARRNRSGIPFDPVTQQLRGTQEAAELSHAEDAARARAAARTAALRARSSAGYNILTGSN